MRVRTIAALVTVLGVIGLGASLGLSQPMTGMEQQAPGGEMPMGPGPGMMGGQMGQMPMMPMMQMMNECARMMAQMGGGMGGTAPGQTPAQPGTPAPRGR